MIRSQNYGSVTQATDTGAFGASPSPPAGLSIQHNQHLSNLGQRSQSDPLVPQSSPTRLRSIYNAAIHSPYLRTYSPRITAKSRRISIDGGSSYAGSSHGVKSPFVVTPGLKTPGL